LAKRHHIEYTIYIEASLINLVTFILKNWG